MKNISTAEIQKGLESVVFLLNFWRNMAAQNLDKSKDSDKIFKFLGKIEVVLDRKIRQLFDKKKIRV